MTVFNVLAGTCGIIAFVVLCIQGARLLRKERHVLLARDPARSLSVVKDNCEKRGLSVTELAGTAAGIEVSGPAYKVRSVRNRLDRESWLSPIPVDRHERR